jgi:biotin transport system substrate-specific component
VKAVAVLAGSWLLAASSWADIPMYPVPMTLQTFAICVVAGLCGARLALAMVIVWFAQAALGLPLLAGGEGGIDAFGGPTAGYLGGFVLAAGVCGRLAENPMMRGWIATTGLFVFAHLLILGLGWARLQLMMGTTAAWEGGVAPFLLGAVAKSVAAAVVVKLIEHVLPWRRTASVAAEP